MKALSVSVAIFVTTLVATAVAGGANTTAPNGVSPQAIGRYSPAPNAIGRYSVTPNAIGRWGVHPNPRGWGPKPRSW